ncbi:MAG: hypothetical protein WBA89_16250 [Microcoleus sp.]|uniref:hypothetical protein n=1 Tax=Microcoleus sp. TaxID=44472 RepID=UPI003C7861F6
MEAFYGRALLPIPQEIHSLWNGPKSPFLRMVQDVCLTGAGGGFNQVDRLQLDETAVSTRLPQVK